MTELNERVSMVCSMLKRYSVCNGIILIHANRKLDQLNKKHCIMKYIVATFNLLRLFCNYDFNMILSVCFRHKCSNLVVKWAFWAKR